MAVTNTPKTNTVLAIIVIAQFACTSLWFAGNAVVTELQQAFNIEAGTIGHITSAVQFGFISGTLVFALFTFSDRFSPSRVFFISALAGAFTNLLIIWSEGFAGVLALRFLTGFFLAGIYPVGMKIASDYHQKGLGKALGLLVGALVLGTAFPHLLRFLTEGIPWKAVIIGTSACSVLGGTVVLLFVPDGPFRKRSPYLDLRTLYRVFKVRAFRQAAFGYFGHMWELYAFWAFIPVILITYLQTHPNLILNDSLLSFGIIGIGGLGCAIGGFISSRVGNSRVAFYALLVSGLCCLVSPFLFNLPLAPFLLILFIWGFAVVTDSPQFSALVAQTAPKENIGTALTIVNSIGFAITIVSIQLISYLNTVMDTRYLFVVLAIGPAFGLWSMYRLMKRVNIGT